MTQFFSSVCLTERTRGQDGLKMCRESDAILYTDTQAGRFSRGQACQFGRREFTPRDNVPYQK